MKVVPIFKIKIINNRIIFNNPDKFGKFLKQNEGKELQLRIEKPREGKKIRSAEQNRYYWGVVVNMIGEETGHFPEEVHEHLKWRFLRIHGKLETVRSTTSLTTIEFVEYCEKCRIWANEFLKLNIPTVDDFYNNYEY